MKIKGHEHFTHEQRINYLGTIPPIIQFVGVILGIFLNIHFPTTMLGADAAHAVGTIFIIGATLFVFWSQRTSAKFRLTEKKGLQEGERRNFHKGPYKWISNPTSFSLAILVIGFGFVMNSLMIVLLSAIGYWLSFIFYEEEKQKIMADKYKGEYEDYRKKVR